MFELTFPFLVRGQIAGAPKFREVKNASWRRGGFSLDVDIPQATLGVKYVGGRTRRVYVGTEGQLAEALADCELMINERVRVAVAEIDSYAYGRETARENDRPSSMMKFTIIGFQSLTRPQLWGVAPGNDDLVPELIPDLHEVSAAA